MTQFTRTIDNIIFQIPNAMKVTSALPLVIGTVPAKAVFAGRICGQVFAEMPNVASTATYDPATAAMTISLCSEYINLYY